MNKNIKNSNNKKINIIFKILKHFQINDELDEKYLKTLNNNTINYKKLNNLISQKNKNGMVIYELKNKLKLCSKHKL